MNQKLSINGTKLKICILLLLRCPLRHYPLNECLAINNSNLNSKWDRYSIWHWSCLINQNRPTRIDWNRGTLSTLLVYHMRYELVVRVVVLLINSWIFLKCLVVLIWATRTIIGVLRSITNSVNYCTHLHRSLLRVYCNCELEHNQDV